LKSGSAQKTLQESSLRGNLPTLGMIHFSKSPAKITAAGSDGGAVDVVIACGTICRKTSKNFLRNGSLPMFVASQPTAFTANSASGLRIEGLRLKDYCLRITALGLRAESDTPFADPLFTGKNDPKMSDFCP
jgi:hypothetical protein